MPAPVEIFVTDQHGKPLEGGTVTLELPELPDQAPVEVTAGPEGAVTVELPDDPAVIVDVKTPSGTFTAPADQIEDLLAPTPAVHRARARARLEELEQLLGPVHVTDPLTAAVQKMGEVLRELTAAVGD
jgi:hypothetical protein